MTVWILILISIGLCRAAYCDLWMGDTSNSASLTSSHRIITLHRRTWILLMMPRNICQQGPTPLTHGDLSRTVIEVVAFEGNNDVCRLQIHVSHADEVDCFEIGTTDHRCVLVRTGIPHRPHQFLTSGLSIRIMIVIGHYGDERIFQGVCQYHVSGSCEETHQERDETGFHLFRIAWKSSAPKTLGPT